MMFRLKQLAIIAGIGLVGAWAASGMIKKFPVPATLGFLLLGYFGRAWIGSKVAGFLSAREDGETPQLVEVTEPKQPLVMPHEKPSTAMQPGMIAADEQPDRGYFDRGPAGASSNPWS